MNVWSELAGQQEAIAVFAAAIARAEQMTHSWLITGPPGSGRSNLAYAFATALLGGSADPSEDVVVQVRARSHPDLHVLATEGVIIKRDDVREIVRRSHYAPAVARYRVIVVEDADRMTEQTSNVLLKELEEPPERTVWILCAPSEGDLIPTIRSRVRGVRLRLPRVEDVARLLETRDGIDPATAERSARHAQSHIGMAHRLATSQEARARREDTLATVLTVTSTSSAVLAAAHLLEVAKEDARSVTEEQDAAEREHTLHSLGVAPGDAVPKGLRGQIKALEADQKRRATRSLRDGIDRILVDVESLFRDILMVQLASRVPPVNGELGADIHAAAERTDAGATLARLAAIKTARDRIDGNVAPALAIEAMLISVAFGAIAETNHAS